MLLMSTMVIIVRVAPLVLLPSLPCARSPVITKRLRAITSRGSSMALYLILDTNLEQVHGSQAQTGNRLPPNVERHQCRRGQGFRTSAAIEGYAKRAAFDIVDTFSDAAVSGADRIDERPGFSAL